MRRDQSHLIDLPPFGSEVAPGRKRHKQHCVATPTFTIVEVGQRNNHPPAANYPSWPPYVRRVGCLCVYGQRKRLGCARGPRGRSLVAICKPTVVAAILVLLAACGGGGGSGGSGDGSEGGSGSDGSGGGSGGGGNGNGGGSGPTGPPPIVGNVQSANPGATLSVASQTAANKPRFGSVGSVTQSSNGDAASASFDGRHVRVTIRRANGSSVAFNSGSHGYVTESGNSLRGDAMLISTDTSVTLAAVTTNWNNADPSNYMAGGYWMHFKGRANPLEVMGGGGRRFRGWPRNLRCSDTAR